MNRVLRTWLIGLAVVVVGLLSIDRSQPHRVLDRNAPATVFSAARARATLAALLGAEQPHPLGSVQDAAMRRRILDEFAALGIAAHTYRAFTCNAWRGYAQIPCATVTDIIADVVAGQGKAVVMMAHYDSVAAGPGASDDGSGVAAVLESARALRAGAGTASGSGAVHPVIALITDGEEAGLLGAHAFLQNPALRARVGAVVNVEARGTDGPSLLFQTSPGDARLLDLYAAHVSAVASSSLFAEIYRYLPNDTDLTLFIRAGIPGFNFAFVGHERDYHSPLDRIQHLNAASLQMQGDNLLGVVRGLRRTAYTALSGPDDIDLSVLDAVLPRVPATWALPLAIAALLTLALASALARTAGRGRSTPPAGSRPVWHAALMPPALIAGAVAIGFVLMGIVRVLSGVAQSGYAHPAPLLIALGFGAWMVTLLVARQVDGWTAAAGAWLWTAGLGVIVAAALPGASPYFTFPALVAAILLLASARAPGGWSGRWGRMALWLSALAAIVVWIALAASVESLRGLRLYPVLMIVAALALIGVVPLLALQPLRRSAGVASIAVSGAAALIAAIVAGSLPPYSVVSPQRLNLIYLRDGSSASWLAEPTWEGHGTGPIPPSLRHAGAFDQIRSVPPLAGGGQAYGGAAYNGAMDAARLPLPGATVIGDVSHHGMRELTVQLHGSPDTDAMLLLIPQAAGLRAIDLRGQHLSMPGGWHGATRLLCLSRDCRDFRVSLSVTGPLPQLRFAEQRYGLPASAAALLAARPSSAMPSQGGDQVILMNTLRLP